MALEQEQFEDELPLPPPKKSNKNSQQDAGDLLPRPPLKKYGYLYFWHKVCNWFR